MRLAFATKVARLRATVGCISRALAHITLCYAKNITARNLHITTSKAK